MTSAKAEAASNGRTTDGVRMAILSSRMESIARKMQNVFEADWEKGKPRVIEKKEEKKEKVEKKEEKKEKPAAPAVAAAGA